MHMTNSRRRRNRSALMKTANRDNSPRPYFGVGLYWGEPYNQGGPESSRAGLWWPFR